MKTKNVINIYSALVSRALLAAKLGSQYSGNRNIYDALGYKTNLTFDDYYLQYTRQDIAAAIINRPVKITWKNGFTIYETQDYEDTQFELEFKKLSTKFSLLRTFVRLDRLVGIGSYGVLLLGLNDVKEVNDWAKPVNLGRKYELVYLKPLSEGSAAILEYDTNTNSPRFGLPNYYSVNISSDSTFVSSRSVKVHWSRCIHVTDDNLESEVFGTPRLQTVFNRLVDLEKIVGSSAEMFWRGARPGYQAKISPDYQLTDEAKDELQEQADEFENNLRRILFLEGVDITALTPQVVNPLDHVDVQVQMISAATGIPKRILLGSEVGELASTEDKNRWFELIEARRSAFAEPCIIRPFVDKCIELGVLTKPKNDYVVKWADIWTMGDKEMAEIGRIRATALKEYASMPSAENIVPPAAFLEVILALKPEDLSLIEEYKRLEVEGEEKRLDSFPDEFDEV